ncbi:hypothetical protein [Vreelandella jeotgali]|uniref:hypothetical protein n=1 Tax=Vreelandella jeotgali TaxID=553386 RepID=UPI00034CD4A4|nr:hypothetical protein [Halomonas jeotgali]
MNRRPALRWLLAPLMMAWPLLIWWLHGLVGSWPLLIAGAGLLAWRFPEARLLAAVAAAGLILLGLVGEAEWGVRAYPVAINAVMLTLFTTSLWQGPPIIERLARLREPDLPPAGCATPAASPRYGADFLCSTAVSPRPPRCTPAWRYGRCITALSATS